MSIESEIFNKKRPDFSRFEEAGFRLNESTGNYHLTAMFPSGDFRAEIEITGPAPAAKTALSTKSPTPGSITGTVIENEFDDVYQAVHVASQGGEFVERVRSEYRKILEQIAELCYYDVPFKDDQANRIAQRLYENYGVSPEFPWDDDTYGSAGVFRHETNEKWFALIMRISEDKIEPEKYKTEKQPKGKKQPKSKTQPKSNSQEPVKPPLLDVINVKILPEDGDELRSENGIYHAFHMNKKSWITIRLDDTVTDERVLELIDASFRLTDGRKGSRRNAGIGVKSASAGAEGGPREWILPANPKYYDIVTDFDNNDKSEWKQGRGIEEGDIVYMYVAVPHQAILYRCRVGKTHIPYKYEGEINVPELMEVTILDRYDKKAFPLSLMKEYHVTQVRGPRYMPQDLAQYIKEHHEQV